MAAGIAEVPEASERTSIKERVDHIKAQGRAEDLKAAQSGSVAGSAASAGLEVYLFWLRSPRGNCDATGDRNATICGWDGDRDAGVTLAGQKVPT